jgi:histone deacetylase 1/2
VHMHEVPPDSMIPEFDEDDLNCDERNGGVRGGDRQIARHDEFYDGDADQDR